MHLWIDPAYDLVGFYFSVLSHGRPGLCADWCADLFINAVTAAVLDI